MKDPELVDFGGCIKDLSQQIDRLMKNKVVCEDQDLKKIVGDAASNFAAILEFDILPRVKLLFPSFRED